MLRTNNRGVAFAFANQRMAKNSNGQFYSDNENGNLVLYSYGLHWPVAAWINGQLHLNDDKRSVTTSKHISYARAALAYAGIDTSRAIRHAFVADMCRAVRGHAL